jgi:hypothetical protein
MAKAIKKVIPAILKPVLDKRGFAQAQIVLDWEKIVGSQMALYGIPERINYYKNATSKGTLVLSVTPGWAPIINHGNQQILERINSYFGYEAVSRLQLKQTFYVKPQSPSAIKPNEETSAVIADIEESIDLDHPNLRKAMARLKHSLQSAK